MINAEKKQATSQKNSGKTALVSQNGSVWAEKQKFEFSQLFAGSSQ